MSDFLVFVERFRCQAELLCVLKLSAGSAQFETHLLYTCLFLIACIRTMTRLSSLTKLPCHSCLCSTALDRPTVPSERREWSPLLSHDPLPTGPPPTIPRGCGETSSPPFSPSFPCLAAETCPRTGPISCPILRPILCPFFCMYILVMKTTETKSDTQV